jgi:hypothetical protein
VRLLIKYYVGGLFCRISKRKRFKKLYFLFYATLSGAKSARKVAFHSRTFYKKMPRQKKSEAEEAKKEKSQEWPDLDFKIDVFSEQDERKDVEKEKIKERAKKLAENIQEEKSLKSKRYP